MVLPSWDGSEPVGGHSHLRPTVGAHKGVDRLVMGVSPEGFCSCLVAWAVVLHGRPPRDPTTPQAAAQIKKLFKQIPPGRFPLPPSSSDGEGTGMHLFLSLDNKKSKPSSFPKHHFSYIFLSSHPISFGGFSGIYRRSTISSTITSAS